MNHQNRHRAGTDCFDNEVLDHIDGRWEIYRCSICGREATYIAKNPYDKSGNPMIVNGAGQVSAGSGK